jgi:hypothetical protein
MVTQQVARQDDGKYLVDQARITFRNFSGAPSQYNAQGVRNFHLILTPEMAEVLANDGFNVKTRPPREEGADPFHHLKINVKTDSNIPPKLFVVTSKGRRQLTEDMLDMLDWADFSNIDLIFSRYRREWPDGRVTVTAYLQTFFGTIREDELELRYSDIPEVEATAQNVLVWQESSPEQIEYEKMLELES